MVKYECDVCSKTVNEEMIHIEINSVDPHHDFGEGHERIDICPQCLTELDCKPNRPPCTGLLAALAKHRLVALLQDAVFKSKAVSTTVATV